MGKCLISKDWSSLYIDGYGVWVLPPTALYNAQDGFRAQRENRFPEYMQSLGAMPLSDLLELAARAEAWRDDAERLVRIAILWRADCESGRPHNCEDCPGRNACWAHTALAAHKDLKDRLAKAKNADCPDHN